MKKEKTNNRKEIKLYVLKSRLWTALFFIYIAGYLIGLITIGTLYQADVHIPKQLLFQYSMIPVYSMSWPLFYLGIYNYNKYKKDHKKSQSR